MVLATGIQGGGEWHIPSFVRESNVPRSLYAHTSESINFDALKGKRVAVLGGAVAAAAALHACSRELGNTCWPPQGSNLGEEADLASRRGAGSMY